MTFPCLVGQAYAGTLPRSSGLVPAQVNGHSFPAITVGNEVYLQWKVLQEFKTPYAYLGDGKFAVTGGTVQGVVYQGNTYLPWQSAAPKVKATKLHSGAFNFTSLPVSHHYHILIDEQDGHVGSPDPFQIILLDGDQPVPNQTMQIRVSGQSFLSGYQTQHSVTVQSAYDGTWLDSLNDTAEETVTLSVSWKDPSGKPQTATVHPTFSATSSTTAAIPSDDHVITQVPISIYDNAVLFNAQAGGQAVLFQLDTGAYEPVLTKQLAESLKLPNLGDIQVQGVGGMDNAYLSKFTVSIGDVVFNDVPCIVDDNYSGTPLFGYEFFTDNGYDLLVSQKHQTITILK
ncbi:retropepsin-like aspartic protease [Alicyclobacillus dauci]|uniref:Retropepsin-like domain-containing protein n=1 Tax=Alicyclobacillus dauci TaxID=1475485 RepID=A0ABY6Z0E7_9BACL|nr:retropepsin-like aspartic protease [Alicyclobacillus dauci]WAH35435.1 retropepsin-like domain-containing protein [Alicyclobacillus dauci]